MSTTAIFCPFCGNRMGEIPMDSRVRRLQCPCCQVCYFVYRTRALVEGKPDGMLLSVMQAPCEHSGE